jgi:hypothetical protein
VTERVTIDLSVIEKRRTVYSPDDHFMIVRVACRLNDLLWREYEKAPNPYGEFIDVCLICPILVSYISHVSYVS